MDAKKTQGCAPSFGIAKVLAPGLLIYLFFSTLFGFFFVFSERVRSELARPSEIVIDLSEGSHGMVRIDSSKPGEISASASLSPEHGMVRILAMLGEAAAVGLGFAAARLSQRDLVRYFHLARRGEPIPEALAAKAKERVWSSPQTMALAGAIPIALESAIRVAWFRPVGDEAFMVPIEVAVLALSTLFTYLWQRHRVQGTFVPLIFSREELASRLPAGHRLPVRRNLTIVVTLATLLPVALVILFVGSGIKVAGSFASLTPDQRRLLFGEVGAELSFRGLEEGHAADALKAGGGLQAALGKVPVPIVGPFDVVRIVLGLSLGLAIAIAYVWLIARWTAADIARPIEELRANMARAEEGDLSALTSATTANELGELTVGFNSMLRGIAERGRIKELFGQYLTKEISEAILDGRVKLGGARYEATVMFTDIRGFTTMSERLEPEEVFAFLNDYLGRMIEVIASRGGIIDKFLGDGILAVFGLPVPNGTHADDAFAAEMDMRLALADLNAERATAGKEDVRIGIGMHSGEVIAGNVGSAKMLQYTVIGDTVNLASRIEGLNKDYGSYLLLSASTYERLGPAARGAGFERIEAASVRGKAEKVDLYRLAAR
jgi:class 3 adenylate cyclase